MEVVAGDHRHHARCRNCQEERVDRRGVEQRDYHDATQVIGYGKRRQKYLQSEWHALAEHCQHTQREGDVGRHRDCTTAQHIGIGRAENSENDDGHQHTATRADDRQDRLAPRRELTRHNFAFDLQAHREEEDRHQEVVDQLSEGEWVAVVAEKVKVAKR